MVLNGLIATGVLLCGLVLALRAQAIRDWRFARAAGAMERRMINRYSTAAAHRRVGIVLAILGAAWLGALWSPYFD
jgi:hypothetical protein